MVQRIGHRHSALMAILWYSEQDLGLLLLEVQVRNLEPD